MSEILKLCTKNYIISQVINGVKDLDVYIEQPCATYEECLSVRRMCPLPMVLDESIDDIGEYRKKIEWTNEKR